MESKFQRVKGFAIRKSIQDLPAFKFRGDFFAEVHYAVTFSQIASKILLASSSVPSAIVSPSIERKNAGF